MSPPCDETWGHFVTCARLWGWYWCGTLVPCGVTAHPYGVSCCLALCDGQHTQASRGVSCMVMVQLDLISAVCALSADSRPLETRGRSQHKTPACHPAATQPTWCCEGFARQSSGVVQKRPACYYTSSVCCSQQLLAPVLSGCAGCSLGVNRPVNSPRAEAASRWGLG